RSNKVLVLAHANHRRRTIPRCHDLVWLINGDYRKRKNAGEFLDGPSHRFFQGRPVPVSVTRKVLLYEMSDNLGVGFSCELMAFFGELSLKGEVVFDNPVVYNHNPARAIPMRMRILFAGPAMGGPAGVANSIGAVKRLLTDDILEIAQFAFR